MCGRTLDGLIEKLPQVNFCCCGCKLSTGTKIIGWLNFIYSVLIEIVWVCIVVGMIIESRKPPKGPDDQTNPDNILAFALIAGPLGGLLIGLVIALAATLLLGVYKNDMKKVRCWLQINLVFFIMGLVFAGLGVLTTLIVKPIAAIAQLITVAINFGISFYLITVVKSYYNEQVAAFQRVSVDHS